MIPAAGGQPRPGAYGGLSAGLAAPPTNIAAVSVTENLDGTVDVSINMGDRPIVEADEDSPDNSAFDENLAETIGESNASALAQVLLEGIKADEDSRREWMQQYTKGLDLLGLKIEEQSSDKGTVSTVRHPLLLASVIRFQSQARGELLPADGPVKVRDDGEQVTAERKKRGDDLARDMNHYLTTTASEYYPDTDRGLFYLAFGGTIFKKVYRCPVRKRPASECVYAPDLIVSQDATDLQNAERITHRITMTKAQVKERQKSGQWLDVDLGAPISQPTVVETAEANIAGLASTPPRPEDTPHVILECYTNIDLGSYGGEEGWLPYRVTMDRDARKVLEIRRNWREDDPQRRRRKRFIKYPFIPGMGFLDYGYLHILGNHTKALTGVLRILIDAGMFSNFPGGVRVKGARMDTNVIRPGPGEWPELETAGMPIRDAIMALPYKGPTAELMSLFEKMEQSGAELAGVVTLETGDGRTNVPVGTIMAQLEQQTQVMSAIHKRLHAAQQEEMILLKELFAEAPEDIWRGNPNPARKWASREDFADLDLVPATDPNVPAHIHRIMQAVALEQLSSAHPDLYDQMAVQRELLSIARLGNADALLRKPPYQQPGGDPNEAAAAMLQQQGQIELLKASMKAKADEQRAQLDALDLQLRTREQAINSARDQAAREAEMAEADKDRKSREAIAAMQAQTQLILKGIEALGNPANPDPVHDDKVGP